MSETPLPTILEFMRVHGIAPKRYYSPDVVHSTLVFSLTEFKWWIHEYESAWITACEFDARAHITAALAEEVARRYIDLIYGTKPKTHWRYERIGHVSYGRASTYLEASFQALRASIERDTTDDTNNEKETI